MKVQLHITTPGRSFSWQGTAAEIAIGRDPACQLALAGEDQQMVSWRHAVLELLPTGAFVTDNASTNGVYVNARRIKKRCLVRCGDAIRLGKNGPTLKIVELALPAASGPTPTQFEPETEFAPPPTPERPPTEASAMASLRAIGRLAVALAAAVAIVVAARSYMKGDGAVNREVANAESSAKPSSEEPTTTQSETPTPTMTKTSTEAPEPKVVSEPTPTRTSTDTTVVAAPNTAAPKTADARVRSILKTHCHRCHGDNGTNEGGFNFLLNRTALVEKGTIRPGNAKDSLLLQRIRSDEMPPPGDEPRPNTEEVEVLEQWVAAGAPDFDTAVVRKFVPTSTVAKEIEDDLVLQSAERRPFLRYFTLTHLYNAGASDDELQTYRHALSKLVNSLSWIKEIRRPEPIDELKTVLRIDLRDYEWTAAVWDGILAGDPYAVSYFDSASQQAARLTKTAVPFVRGDWFVFAASRPPLYHKVLQLPKTDAELESKRLMVDVRRNLAEGTAVRAGFIQSGVSAHNRLIERHRSPYGAYWKSYDFAASTGSKNLLDRPLGPQSMTKVKAFEHDGGELIFNLPNGLQGYMLVDGAGKIIDKGPTEIVSDPRQPDRAVVNGISCMSCHYAGIIRKDDDVRAAVEANRTAFADADLILKLYVPREKMRALLDDDAERFRAAVTATGANLSKDGDPIVNMALRFQFALDLKLAAAEAGIEPPSLRAKIQETPELQRVLSGLLIEGGRVKRDTFRDAFPDVVRVVGLGSVFDSRLPP